MIMVSRLNGQQFALNPDLIERAEATPDTVITLVDGTRLVVKESVVDLMERIRWMRASILASAAHIDERGFEAAAAREAEESEYAASADSSDDEHRVVPISRGL